MSTAVTTSWRRLADVARPAGGRPVDHHVLFVIAHPDQLVTESRRLAYLVDTAAGVTRCGSVVVEPAFTADAVALALARPEMRNVPTHRVGYVAGMYAAITAQLGLAPVLLVGRCPVLWPQVSTLLNYS